MLEGYEFHSKIILERSQFSNFRKIPFFWLWIFSQHQRNKTVASLNFSLKNFLFNFACCFRKVKLIHEGKTEVRGLVVSFCRKGASDET